MKSDWSTKTVEELIADGIIEKPLDGNHGGIHPTSKDFIDSGIPFVMASDIKEGRIDFSNCKYISEETAKGLQKGFSKPKDVLLTHKATIGRTAIVGQLDTEYIMLTPQVTYYRIKDFNSLSSIYLKYYFDSKNFQDIFHSWASGGSTRAYLGITAQRKLPIVLPPLPTQKKIAHILSTLDDKIELNRKMNQTLEEMAQALFKSWFVDFDPVHAKSRCNIDGELEAAAKELGISKEVLELFPNEFVESEMGMIPLGWEVSTIEDEVNIYGGATPSTKEDKYWIGGENHWATPKDLSGLNSKVLIDTGRKITDDGVKKISSKQLPIGTILLSSRAPVGYIAYATIPISINQGFIAMVCNKKLSNYYIMYWLDIAMNEIKSRAIGTTFSEISKSAFRPIKLVVASDEVITAFDTMVAPMVNKLIANEYEIESLTKTRDTLLPKLLSGELDVSKVEL